MSRCWTPRTFAVFEKVASWLGLGSGGFAVHAAGSALLGRGGWGRFLVAAALSAAGARLAREFKYNKERRRYEGALIAQGHSPEDAARAWAAYYSLGTDDLSRARAILARRKGNRA